MTKSTEETIYLARIGIGAGGTWQKGTSKHEAVRKCVSRAIEDWSSLYDLESAQKAGQLEVDLYLDGGTESFDDDTYIETVTAYRSGGGFGPRPPRREET